MTDMTAQCKLGFHAFFELNAIPYGSTDSSPSSPKRQRIVDCKRIELAPLHCLLAGTLCPRNASYAWTSLSSPSSTKEFTDDSMLEQNGW